MKKNTGIKTINLKLYLLPLLGIILIFLIIGINIMGVLEEYFVDEIKDSSRNIARGYVSSITKSRETENIILSRMDEKLISTGRFASLFADLESGDDLKALAGIMVVGEINVYNSQGRIISSNINEYIGWSAPPDHPANILPEIDKKYMTEEVRPNNVTGELYKYGYYLTDTGHVIQTGIQAENIDNFLEIFMVKELLEEMVLIDEVEHAFFISPDKTVISGSGKEIKDYVYGNPSAIENPETGGEFERIILDENEYFVFYYPVLINNEPAGVLAIYHSLETVNKIRSQFALIGLSLLFAVFLCVVYIIVSTYIKNRKLSEIAYIDGLTGLGNYSYLKSCLRNNIENEKAYGNSLLLLNCVSFKTINMTSGYEFGNNIIKEIAKKLNMFADKETDIFSLSSDRFVIYCRGKRSQKEIANFSERICALFDSPLAIDGIKKYVSVQLGIVSITKKYKTSDDLLKDLMISVDFIDPGKSGSYMFFDENMEEKTRRNEIIASEIRDIIRDEKADNLSLQYQPVTDLKTGNINGFEALARYVSPEIGSISAREFIDTAESNQLMISLGKIILKKACSFGEKLKTNGFAGIKTAVNISGIQLMDDDFVKDILETVKISGMEISDLEIEITESVLLDNFEKVNKKLDELNKEGIETALDDFGTGYSSLLRLNQLNIHKIKIDRYFVNKISSDKKDNLISKEIISLAQNMGLKVVAEGVESEEQRVYLSENGCDMMQGYLFSKPLSENDAIEILGKTNS